MTKIVQIKVYKKTYVVSQNAVFCDRPSSKGNPGNKFINSAFIEYQKSNKVY